MSNDAQRGRRQHLGLADASRATVELFIESGSSAFPVPELAAHAGVSERTFHRYFPRKEDAVRPFLRGGLERVIDMFSSAAPGLPLRQAVEDAWARSWPVRYPREAARLHAVLAGSELLHAVLLQEVLHSERRWASALAASLGVDARSATARMAGAAVVAAFRLSWAAWSDHPDLDPMIVIREHNEVCGHLLEGRTTPPG
ncbi:TetR/AcrR family transcriptional regulator [Amycolatopsis sp.]|uniref:TetR/AcrR family transcriptional regulator n=1 Tax=Amycolatopsis sp. TaxID=37632 RepID=UPI002CAB2773|nr:TetR family transcriptional regulator [Amycolatopsis sp.]HVV08021.1 TetR family transcriptional regulator [Amycolatopsis sp.]